MKLLLIALFTAVCIHFICYSTCSWEWSNPINPTCWHHCTHHCGCSHSRRDYCKLFAAKVFICNTIYAYYIQHTYSCTPVLRHASCLFLSCILAWSIYTRIVIKCHMIMSQVYMIWVIYVEIPFYNYNMNIWEHAIYSEVAWPLCNLNCPTLKARMECILHFVLVRLLHNLQVVVF